MFSEKPFASSKSLSLRCTDPFVSVIWYWYMSSEYRLLPDTYLILTFSLQILSFLESFAACEDAHFAFTLFQLMTVESPTWSLSVMKNGYKYITEYKNWLYSKQKLFSWTILLFVYYYFLKICSLESVKCIKITLYYYSIYHLFLSFFRFSFSYCIPSTVIYFLIYSRSLFESPHCSSPEWLKALIDVNMI